MKTQMLDVYSMPSDKMHDTNAYKTKNQMQGSQIPVLD